jgi:ribosome-binding factor A
MTSYRKEKLEEVIRRIVGEALIKEIKDPRIGFATVTYVKLSKDYAAADIGISVIGEEKDKKKTMAGIDSASGYIQHLVGKDLSLRITPRLKFHLDETIEEAVKMVGLIDTLEKGTGDKDDPKKSED